MTQPPYPGSEGDPGNRPSEGSDLPPTHQPYGQQQPSYGQQPYGQQPAYGQSDPYGAWQGGNDASKGTDGLSIAAFVLSLTCCLSIVGVILGFVGLGRTKDGMRKGRWAAISAIIIGLVLTLVSIGIGVAVYFIQKDSITPGNAKVGQCVNVKKFDDGDDATYGLKKQDCSESHDAEVVVVATFSEGDTDTTVFCEQRLTDEQQAAREELDLKLKGITDDPPPGDGDKILCYFEKDDGTKLTEKISD